MFQNDLYIDDIDQENDDLPCDINNGRGRAGQEVPESVIRRYFTQFFNEYPYCTIYDIVH